MIDKKLYTTLSCTPLAVYAESEILAASYMMPMQEATVEVDSWEAVKNESGNDFFEVTFEHEF